jgi:glycosyltransferase involved in cell wall biosynthesis
MAVVANENSALRLLLKNSENSLVVEPTATSVAEAISCLVRDTDRRNALASEGLKTAQQTSWIREIDGVYEFLTGHGKTECEATLPDAAHVGLRNR